MSRTRPLSPGGPPRPWYRGRTLIWLLRLVGLLLVLLVIRGALAPRPLRFVPAHGVVSGCGAHGVASGSASYALTSGGRTRTYLLHVPRGYTPRRAFPLVINFHGYSMSGALEARYSAMSALADRAGFVVVYPDGTPQRRPLAWLFPRLGWNQGYNQDFPGDDVRFTNDLIDLLARQLCLDRRRVYAVGLSNGGGMADDLACVDSARIAAIATVAGAFHPLPGGCHPARPLAVLAIQGTADPVVPYLGYGTGPHAIPSTLDWAAAWARRDGCPAQPVMRSPAPDVMQISRGGCRAGTAVTVDFVIGGGHTWPGARDHVVALGRTATDFDATRAIWQFLRQFAS